MERGCSGAAGASLPALLGALRALPGVPAVGQVAQRCLQSGGSGSDCGRHREQNKVLLPRDSLKFCLFLMSEARLYNCVQPVISKRVGYEMFPGKIAKAYSAVWKGFKDKINELRVL